MCTGTHIDDDDITVAFVPLTKVEYDALRCQIGISKNDDTTDGRGGRRYMPYAFTEQGIA
jgi:hypothetical protein